MDAIELHRAETLRLIAMEESVVAGRDRFTVFKWGQRWAYVHWSGRPSGKFDAMEEAIRECRDYRDMYGLQHIPITLEVL